MKPEIRILIADDHAVVRKGLSMILALEDDFEIVGEAVNAEEAVRMGVALAPDLVLLDRMMPGSTGPEVVSALKQRTPESRILLLTGTEVDESVIRIVEAGVDGYALKDIDPGELKRAIRMVAAGETYLHPQVSRILMSAITRSGKPKGVGLTPRETEVLRLMATPSTYRAIAEQLSISEETVRSHAKNLLAKLGQPNRAQAVLYAVRIGLIDI